MKFMELGCALAFIISLFSLGAAVLDDDAESEFYYLPCEVVATNETSTYFGTVDQGVQQIYAANTGEHQWPDDVPYLLYMDSKGTKDISDDEILVVWRTD